MNEPTDSRPPKTDTSGLLNQCVMNTPVIVNENLTTTQECHISER